MGETLGVSDVYGQRGSRVRLEWGPAGAAATVVPGDVAVVVDVLSFTTTLSVAIDRGATVYPYRWRDRTALDYARSRRATLAVGRFEAARSDGLAQVTLSPVSIRAASGLHRLVLPSPNGSAICFGLADSGATVVGACLRNRTAVAAWVRDRLDDGTAPAVTLVAAGERWPDGSLRPAVEDLWGAGAVVAALADLGVGGLSPEAAAAAAAFRDVRGALPTALDACTGGQELAAASYADDVTVAAELDTTGCVPVLTDDRFADATAAQAGHRSPA